MHPVLLDDKSLFYEFEAFIEAIDNVHELALDRNQQFPVHFTQLLFSFLPGKLSLCYDDILFN